jgi:TolB protein
VINLNGSDQKELVTSGNADIVNPDWSPDDIMIAYADRPAGGVRSEIFTVNADGSNPIRLTENAFSDLFPAWTPE